MHGPTIQAQTEFYNKTWTATEFANLYGLERCQFILDCILQHRLERPRILDLGCGTGWLTGVLSAFGPATGVELSNEAVERARGRYPQVQFIAGDILQWTWDGPLFDVVVSQEVIEHVPDQAGYLAVAARVLRPGGLLILTTPNRDTLDALPEDVRRKWLWQPVELPLTRTGLQALLARDFEVLSVSSRVLGFGETLSYRLANSCKFQALLAAFGLRQPFLRWLQNAGFGMYQTVCARRRGTVG